VDGSFEWKAIKGQRVKQPYAVTMMDGAPFGRPPRCFDTMPAKPGLQAALLWATRSFH
jgi:hypothetical protein